MTGKSCMSCRYIRKEEESWEMSHIYWYECVKVPQNNNLCNFPFNNTKCKYFEESSSRNNLISLSSIKVNKNV